MITYTTAPKDDEVRQWQGVPAGALVILRTLVGSTVHGTAVAGTDDRDEMAIVIEPAAYTMGLREFETKVHRTQPDGARSGPGDLDLVIHSLRKFARLAEKGNPSVLIPLYVPITECVGKIHAFGHQLRAERDMFISKNVTRSFLGYMVAQRQRLLGDRGQMRVTRTELVEKYGFDTKYAGHVVRLGLQGLEMTKYGRLTLPMARQESTEVVDVRTGRYTFEQVCTRMGELERELKDAMDISELPDKPHVVAIDKFLVRVHLATYAPQQVMTKKESNEDA